MKLEGYVRIVLGDIGEGDKTEVEVYDLEVFQTGFNYADAFTHTSFVKEQIQDDFGEGLSEAIKQIPNFDKENVYEIIAEFWGEEEFSSTWDGDSYDYFWELRNVRSAVVNEKLYADLGLVAPPSEDDNDEPPSFI